CRASACWSSPTPATPKPSTAPSISESCGYGARSRSIRPSPRSSAPSAAADICFRRPATRREPLPGSLRPRSARYRVKPTTLKLLAFDAELFRRKPRDETILLRTKPFSRWRAEVRKRWLINNLPNEALQKRRHWESVMPNVIAINDAGRQGIIAAQATSDEMLLESIADGGRTAMHILYSRHNVRVFRFVLRIVR